MNIKLTDKDKKRVQSPNDVYEIMQRILLRENKIDKEKEHFWIVGMNTAGYILYIELVTLGTVRAAMVEPMNVYRVAVMKNATRVIAVHNHPAGTMEASEEDKDITDRLIQVGKILKIDLEDHLIISPTTYFSFNNAGLMAELRNSLKYVPTYLIVEQIRREERKIAKQALQSAKDRTKVAKEKAKDLEQQLASAITFLREKDISLEQIAQILGIPLAEVKKIITKSK